MKALMMHKPNRAAGKNTGNRVCSSRKSSLASAVLRAVLEATASCVSNHWKTMPRRAWLSILAPEDAVLASSAKSSLALAFGYERQTARKPSSELWTGDLSLRSGSRAFARGITRSSDLYSSCHMAHTSAHIFSEEYDSCLSLASEDLGMPSRSSKSLTKTQPHPLTAAKPNDRRGCNSCAYVTCVQE